MARVLILPGLGDSGPQHWQSLWQRSDPRIRRVEQHDWHAPQLDAWCETLERAVGESTERARGIMAQKARERARSWPDRYAAFAHFRERPAFARIADDVLWDYVHAGTLEADHGATALLFPPELELQLNTVPPNTWRALGPGLSPLRLVRGTLSHLLSTRHLRRWSRLRPADELVELPGAGHLLPFEQPTLVAEHIARDPELRFVLP